MRHTCPTHIGFSYKWLMCNAFKFESFDSTYSYLVYTRLVTSLENELSNLKVVVLTQTVVVLTQTTGLLNHLKPLLRYVMLTFIWHISKTMKLIMLHLL